MNGFMVQKGVSILALSVVLGACGQAAADEPSASPKPSVRPAPAQPSAEPSREPVKPVATPKPSLPAEEPAEQPAEQPNQEPAPVATPKPAVVVKHELPMIGHVTRDGVAVRVLPSLDAPLVTGGIDGDGQPNIRLDTGEVVLVMLGPVFADGVSWYEVSAGSQDRYVHRGWVAGEFLASDGIAEVVNGVIGSLNGIGQGGTATADVTAWSPLMVRYAATPADGDDACDIEVVLVGVDGTETVIGNEHVTNPVVGPAYVSGTPLPYMERDGTIQLRVTTDCSFAAAVNIPQG